MHQPRGSRIDQRLRDYLHRKNSINFKFLKKCQQSIPGKLIKYKI